MGTATEPILEKTKAQKTKQASQEKEKLVEQQCSVMESQPVMALQTELKPKDEGRDGLMGEMEAECQTDQRAGGS